MYDDGLLSIVLLIHLAAELRLEAADVPSDDVFFRTEIRLLRKDRENIPAPSAVHGILGGGGSNGL